MGRLYFCLCSGYVLKLIISSFSVEVSSTMVCILILCRCEAGIALYGQMRLGPKRNVCPISLCILHLILTETTANKYSNYFHGNVILGTFFIDFKDITRFDKQIVRLFPRLHASRLQLTLNSGIEFCNGLVDCKLYQKVIQDIQIRSRELFRLNVIIEN